MDNCSYIQKTLLGVCCRSRRRARASDPSILPDRLAPGASWLERTCKRGSEDPGRGSRRGSSDGQVSRRREGTDSPRRAPEGVPDSENLLARKVLWGPEIRPGLLAELTPSDPLSGPWILLSERGFWPLFLACPQLDQLTWSPPASFLLSPPAVRLSSPCGRLPLPSFSLSLLVLRARRLSDLVRRAQRGKGKDRRGVAPARRPVRPRAQ